MTLNVTQPDLCDIETFSSILKSAWNTGILTHNGPILQSLEKQITEALDIPDYCAVTNGTIALQLAIKALDISGTVVIPAFTWIATAAAALWEGCDVRLCDIDPETLNLDIKSLSRVTDTSVKAIIPVHVFGNPCDVDEITLFAKEKNVKVIYDAAHAFGSTFNGNSVLQYGDISCTSSHATKIFNTGEGGGLISKCSKLQDRFRRLRFFGYDNQKNIKDCGINAKMTEIHAALGIGNLPNLQNTIQYRNYINNKYRHYLSKAAEIRFQKVRPGSNNAYFPIIFGSEKLCTKTANLLEDNDILARRYFYPSMSEISPPSSKDETFNSDYISKRILCLPSHNSVTDNDIKEITDLIIKATA